MKRIGFLEFVRWGARIDFSVGRGWRVTLGAGVVNPEKLCVIAQGEGAKNG